MPEVAIIINNKAMKALNDLGIFQRSKRLQKEVISMAIYPETNSGIKMALAIIIKKMIIMINSDMKTALA